jgi:hypothetical protein
VIDLEATKARIWGAVENRRRRFLTADEVAARVGGPAPAARGATATPATPIGRAPDTGGLDGPGRVLPVGPVTDQGNTPACGGYAVANAVLCRAQIDGTQIPAAQASAYGMQVYRWCISGYDWSKYPGLSYLPTYALSHGVATAGAAAATIGEVADAIRAGSPVDISVRWYTSMSAAPRGRMTVRPDTNRESFHAVCVVGYDPAVDFQYLPIEKRRKAIARRKKRGKPIPDYLRPDLHPAFLIRNSWGTSWGDGGVAWIKATDLEALLVRGARDGDEIGNAFYALDWSPVDVPALYAGDTARHGA